MLQQVEPITLTTVLQSWAQNNTKFKNLTKAKHAMRCLGQIVSAMFPIVQSTICEYNTVFLWDYNAKSST